VRVAILDLGTNTFNMLIADIGIDHKYTRIYSSKIPVKLGEGGINDNYITEAAFERGLLALKNQIIALKNHGCERAIAFGTSALRDATNGVDFVNVVKQTYDLNVQIIDGDREAQMIYKGVKMSLDMGNEKSLIMDIGGGSTEFIIANRDQIFWKKSYKLGVSRLIQWLKPSDPISEVEIEKLKSHLNAQMGELYLECKNHGIKKIIGSSGSFDSLAEMISVNFYGTPLPEDATTHDFSKEDFNRIREIVLSSTKEQRLEMRGLHRIRVDFIVMAVILIDLVIEKCNIRTIKQSDYALKEGILFDILEGNL
jgi:exopolyphosphatase / guanosine-5'-triphosphate,3'-diphosphate pyrophosphatase